MKRIFSHPSSYQNLLYWLGTGLVLTVLIRTAWQSDDAYITYRCIDNALNGYDLTYNVVERVQAFTHPLWALFQLVVAWFTGEVYFTGIFSGMLFSLLTLWVIGKRLVTKPLAFLTLCGALLSSSAFVDYSTSGLENALSYFLAAMFLAEWLGSKRLGRLSLLAALLVLNRMDLLLLVGPALFSVWWPQRSFRSVGIVLLGFLPFILWELFAIFYYGFPFPNTAYAKLNLAIPSGELFLQGLDYIWASFANDFPTIFLLGLGLLLGLARRSGEWFAIALGVALYLAYVVKIGGDFMEGRFFTVPFLMATIMAWKGLEDRFGQKAQMWTAGTAIAMLGIAGIQYPASYLTGKNFKRDRADIIMDSGVADERAYYYHQTGLLKVLSEPDRAVHEWMLYGFELKNSGTEMFLTHNMGFLGYAAGPDVYLVDAYALTDPLLARFPPIYNPDWRPGHLGRAVPEGYLEGLAKHQNSIVAPDLHELYENLLLVTRGDLWSWERIKTIVHLNTGGQKVEGQNRFLYPVHQSRDADYPVYPGEPIPESGELNVRLGNHRGVQIKMKPFGGELRMRMAFGEDASYVAIYRGEDGFFEGRLIGNGAEGWTLNEDGTVEFTWDLSQERSIQEGDFLVIYGLPVYGEQFLKYVQVGDQAN